MLGSRAIWQLASVKVTGNAYTADLVAGPDLRPDYSPTPPQRALELPCAFPKVQTAGMPNKKRKRSPKTVLKLPDLEQSKSAVLNSLTSPSSQRSYDHAICDFIDWYCSEPRLAFNKTVVTRYRISL